jgi:hypothetical protein
MLDIGHGVIFLNDPRGVSPWKMEIGKRIVDGYTLKMEISKREG